MSVRLRRPRRQQRFDRMAVFIDGFNVYHGLRDKDFRRFYWLDFRALAETFVRPGQQLVAVTYFTARVNKPADSKKRQSTYLDALTAHGGLEIVEGKYKHRQVQCKSCGTKWDRPNEKMTDVNIALRLASGALRDEYDTALLVCADADLIPAVQLARSAGKRVLVVSPRGRTSDDLTNEADAHLHISTTVLGRCQLPNVVTTASGIALARPSTWQ